MNSFTAKPYGQASKHSSLPKPGTQGQNPIHKAGNTLPSLSGDILKQSIASMQTKKPGKHSKPAAPASKSSATPVISESEILQRRSSMHRTPPPPTPDNKQNFDQNVPEFLRKKLKRVEAPENEQEKQKNLSEDNEPKLDESLKKSFRNSRLLFESNSAAPTVAPKPKPRSFKSNNGGKHEGRTDQGQGNSKAESTLNVDSANADVHEDSTCEHVQVERSKTASDEGQQNNVDSTVGAVDISPEEPSAAETSISTEEMQTKEQAENLEDNSLRNPKPTDVTLPAIPTGLSAWMARYVKENLNLRKLENRKSEAEAALPGKEMGTTSTVTVEEEDFYDDVNTGSKDAQADEPDVYDDVQCSEQQLIAAASNGGDEVYDDVAGCMPSAADTTADDCSYEVYDDVRDGPSDDVYDDVAAGVPRSTEAEQDVYDDVNNGQTPVYEVEEGGNEGQDEPGLYEPVESIQQFVQRDRASKDVVDAGTASANDKANKRREEKERKEREKLEKKKKEEAEKKFRKEEEERKRKEREERKRIEKERKSFNLKPEEDPVPTERHFVSCNVKGKGKDLTITRGEYLDVISMNNCPKGKVLVQNCYGKLGYVLLKDLGLDKRVSLIEASSPVATGVAFGHEKYEDVCFAAPPSQTAIMSLSENTSAPTFAHFSKPASRSKSAAQEDKVEDAAEGGDIYEVI